MPFLALAWGFFTKNPLGQKIGIVLVCLLFAGLALRWYGNGQYYKGRNEGVKQGAEDIRKSQEAAWKERELQLENDRKALDEAGEELQKQMEAIEAIRKVQDTALAKIRATGQARQEASNAIVNSIPGDLLDDALRRKSAELGPPKDFPPAPK